MNSEQYGKVILTCVCFVITSIVLYDYNQAIAVILGFTSAATAFIVWWGWGPSL